MASKNDSQEIGIAFDIGTTTIVAESYLRSTGDRISSVVEQNSQIVHGFDLRHRLGFATRKITESKNTDKKGISILHEEFVRQVNSLAKKLCEKTCARLGGQNLKIVSIVITGNTVMLSMAAGLPCEGFKVFPYSPPSLFGIETTWQKFSSNVNNIEENEKSILSPQIPVYIPPCVGAFFGADAICAMFVAGFSGSIFSCKENLLPGESPVTAPLLLADIGTSCELALFIPQNQQKSSMLICTAINISSAFSASNIVCGMSPVNGAIDRVVFEKDKFRFHVIGDCRPKGICGHGLVSLISVLYKNHFIDKSGVIIKGMTKTGDGSPCIELTPAVRITQQDLKNFQIAKSALRTAIDLLLTKTPSMPIFSICGGCGPLFSIDDAFTLGILPQNVSKHTIRLGNASLAGAASMLFSRSRRESAQQIAKKVKFLDLSRETQFQQRFLSSMDFE